MKMYLHATECILFEHIEILLTHLQTVDIIISFYRRPPSSERISQIFK